MSDAYDCKQAMELLHIAESTLEAHVWHRDRLREELRSLDEVSWTLLWAGGLLVKPICMSFGQVLTET